MTWKLAEGNIEEFLKESPYFSQLVYENDSAEAFSIQYIIIIKNTRNFKTALDNLYTEIQIIIPDLNDETWEKYPLNLKLVSKRNIEFDSDTQYVSCYASIYLEKQL